MTSMDTASAISSPASAFGATPLERLDGQMILPCGQEAVPASLSVRAGKGEASQISVTYGLHGSGSLASAALTQSLASRLRPVTDLLGSTLYRLTWKERVTPSGRRIPALRASGRRTSGSDCTSWPTPDAQKTTSQGTQDRPSREATGRTTGYLAEAVKSYGQPAAWPTPNRPDGGRQPKGGSMTATGMTPDGKKRQVDLQWVAKLTTWPTPNAQDSEGGGQAKRAVNPERSNDLNDFAQLATWATPRVSDERGASKPRIEKAANNEESPIQLREQVCLTVSGETPNGSGAATASTGQLNPAHSRWLQGLPTAWDDCGVTVTRSVRRKQKPSSGPIGRQ